MRVPLVQEQLGVQGVGRIDVLVRQVAVQSQPPGSDTEAPGQKLGMQALPPHPAAPLGIVVLPAAHLA